ncbi:DUF2877 domain-containing protein [Pseudonocardia endophytica]|uniref:oxamate carbamoyltransferase subunit AllH family protein n=1 Tax=Pseudonocardia endophytica TaxID=401976 RepID=UPI0014054D9E|nr:DUF2877 domain-containing protein [Pseudonocardia endophytica]
MAVREAARAGARGHVESVHRKAVYLELDGALVALVSADVEPGPLHLCSGPLPPAVAGERVACDGSRIAARTWAVRCDVPTWQGALPASWSRDSAGHVARPDGVGPDGPAVAATPRPWETAIPGDVPADPGPVHVATRRGAVEELAGLLGGRGPGLTPAGDDLLAGIVLVARARWGTAAEARLDAAVAGVRTTGAAAAFLHWAARGHSLAPAHDVLVSLAAGRADERAESRLSAIGASSGACLLAGLRIGVAQLPRLDTRSTRAGSDVAL